jgi:hypothetical protein
VTTQGLLYTEADIDRLLHNRRFLAAVHAYSLGTYPLGEAVTRAAEARPYVPRWIEILGYDQLIHEVAERIYNGEVVIPGALRLG